MENKLEKMCDNCLHSISNDECNCIEICDMEFYNQWKPKESAEPSSDVEKMAEELYPFYVDSILQVHNCHIQHGFIAGYKKASKELNLKLLESLNKELENSQEEIINSPIRFNGVHIIKIRAILKKYGLPMQSDF
jgi:hypothetical protein